MTEGNDLVIETSGLKRCFGSLTAVDNLDLNVPQGKVFGFLGPNGAGKTTTIRMLLGLIRPTAGRVSLFGQDAGSDRAALLGRIGALVEAPSLYVHLSGRENLEITRRLRGLEPGCIDRSLQTVGLAEAADRRVGGYSQGMKQRLALGLALLGEPELLILDEPTNGLDPAGIREIRHFIRSLPREQGISVFLSSHLLNEVEQVADSIAIIRRGCLIFQGPLEDLQARSKGHIHVRVDNPEKALQLIRELGYEHASLDEDGALMVPASGDREAARINSRLVEHGVCVYGLKQAQPSLEDLFLSLTNEAQGEQL
ncbi:MAG: ABC transporter ATP-binding protein [Candidatus Aminicenantaceae bacterium]